ncbi:hypothetical protein PR202_gb11101 [Eleusine coracana subsp. coracana]|uniref:Pentatricopeptide repeat-containing protein n=1 Tax=Eleusine coracana subsp. coracana TaxID=191504 RepID=A0AAV5EM76_ELECO|nr:hypothetical protein PR202_gb11101 [Eleusine coracana subsp. coracana]
MDQAGRRYRRQPPGQRLRPASAPCEVWSERERRRREVRSRGGSRRWGGEGEEPGRCGWQSPEHGGARREGSVVASPSSDEESQQLGASRDPPGQCAGSPPPTAPAATEPEPPPSASLRAPSPCAQAASPLRNQQLPRGAYSRSIAEPDSPTAFRISSATPRRHRCGVFPSLPSAAVSPPPATTPASPPPRSSRTASSAAITPTRRGSPPRCPPRASTPPLRTSSTPSSAAAAPPPPLRCNSSTGAPHRYPRHFLLPSRSLPSPSPAPPPRRPPHSSRRSLPSSSAPPSSPPSSAASRPQRLLPFALSLFSSRPDHDHPNLFLSFLEALSKAGHVAAAEQLVEELQPRLPLSLRHYTALLYGWCRLGKLDEAKHVLARMKAAEVAPDVVAFNTLLAGFVADGRFEDAFDLAREMERRGCPPNAVSYTTLMQGLGTRGRVDEAMRVFVEMRRKGCAPDSVTYGTLVTAFCKAGKVSQGYEFLEAMSRDGLRVDAAVYHGFFVAHEKKEQLEECLELMERMTECRRPLDLKVYNVVIRLACKLGETKHAMTLWNEMENGGLSPGVDTFSIMVNGLVGQGELIEACSYFKDMVGRGLFVAPQYGVLKDLLNALVKDDKLELAKDIWGCIVNKGCELNVSAWTIWIHALYAKKHVKEACMYCLDMLEAGLMPQPDTFAKLMKGLKKLYNRQVAAEITEKVRKMAEERHVSFKMYKRRGVRDLEDKPKSKRRKGHKWNSRRQAGQGHSSRHADASDDDQDKLEHESKASHLD